MWEGSIKVSLIRLRLVSVSSPYSWKLEWRVERACAGHIYRLTLYLKLLIFFFFLPHPCLLFFICITRVNLVAGKTGIAKAEKRGSVVSTRKIFSPYVITGVNARIYPESVKKDHTAKQNQRLNRILTLPNSRHLAFLLLLFFCFSCIYIYMYVCIH